ncbi:Patatin-like phospholipase [Leminorella grimontii]|uniref:patatin-like phospholipase family protein n=1 Tax=Leminorella grimontii TaxID=82981 RepID=UPI0010B2680E|nr:patatin-like phospholipase family protein [Leminorella grimontii]VFS56685.1 Patatin-like phospholipase [Leminorella grimontii]
MKYPFENLVFEGGGVKGIAYVGALEVLEEEGILDNVKNVAGSSVGAIAAVLVGLGYKNARLKNHPDRNGLHGLFRSGFADRTA